MSRAVALFVVLSLTLPAVAGDPPLVEKYLHAGDLARGEIALEAALEKAPRDDQIRFGLGFLRVVKAVERLGQSLHHYGLKPNQEWVPTLRLPVPANPEPAAISYRASRRIVEDFLRDLAAAEATLAGVTDDHVTLPLRVAKIRMDLTGRGTAEDSFTDVVKRMMGRLPDVLRDNPDLLISFDRGDVAWLRAYCHLVMGVCELYLAVDSEAHFRMYGGSTFARVTPRLTDDEAMALRDKRQNWVIPFREPERLGRFRKHLVEVCKQNRETWRFVRAETDDDHEWLPNPRQHGVLGLPVREEMIITWLRMIDEFEGLLEGRTVVSFNWQDKENFSRGLNIRKFLDNPPTELDIMDAIGDRPGNPYVEKGKPVNVDALSAGFSMFSQPLMMGYAAWFN